jgi:hypothetical protein
MDARDNSNHNPFDSKFWSLEWIASAMAAAHRHNVQRREREREAFNPPCGAPTRETKPS